MIKDAHITTTTQPTERRRKTMTMMMMMTVKEGLRAAYRENEKMFVELSSTWNIQAKTSRKKKVAVGMGNFFLSLHSFSRTHEDASYISADNNSEREESEERVDGMVKTTTTLKLKHIYRCMMIMIKRLKRYRRAMMPCAFHTRTRRALSLCLKVL